MPGSAGRSLVTGRISKSSNQAVPAPLLCRVKETTSSGSSGRTTMPMRCHPVVPVIPG
jgi:hypothetical protein